MAKMAAMPIYGTNLKSYSLSEPLGRLVFKGNNSSTMEAGLLRIF